jgi:nitrogen fixation protein NifZ
MATYQMGDLVLAALDLFNDELTEEGESMLPDIAPNALLAATGTRGVIVNVGHIAADPGQEIYLVRFESGEGKLLGPPIGCVPEELTQPA